jgi:hypothetical protein
MSEGFISRGFRGRRTRPEGGDRLPPGQYLVDGFPVLSAGPAPHTPLEEWDFSIVGEVDEPKKWTWEEFRQLPSERLDGLQPSHRPGDARGDRPFPRAASARLRLRSHPACGGGGDGARRTRARARARKDRTIRTDRRLERWTKTGWRYLQVEEA